MTNLRSSGRTPDVDARSGTVPNASSSSRFATESKESPWERYFAAAIAANDCRDEHQRGCHFVHRVDVC
jgi:hypothetical protein